MLTRFPAILGRTLVATMALAFAAFTAVHAQAPRVLPPGTLPNDVRLQPLKDLDGYFPFTPPASKAEWERRAERVRRQILVSQGLWPMPTKTPLKAVIHGRVEREDYTVEKVYFESAPGLFVTGNLYRPRNVTGRAPAVLFAHGHWTNARLSESTDAELLREIADGEERFEQGGRSRFQSMCVQLARMGCVVWQWDMLSDSDAVQFSRQLVHGFAKQRPEMNRPEEWGLYSPAAESHLQSIMGLQTLNAVRSLDFVLSLPEVDPDRVAMTGASGGGTQTMILAAIDPRLALSFPAVMVSTAMQGGCTCENACLLRVDTGNVEFAALFAPKPQGMTTANDWTREMSAKGFPELKQLYAMLGAADKVMLKRGEHFPHNYNAVSRGAFYGWVNKHFKLGLREPVVERDYAPLTREQLTVWDDAHPAPKAADPDFERQLLRWFQNDTQNQLQAAAHDPARYRAIVEPALEIVFGGPLPGPGQVVWEMKKKEDRGEWIQMAGLLRHATRHEELPAVFCYPKKWNGRTVLWLGRDGKAALFTGVGTLRPEVQKLVESGATVLGLDLLHQGEFLANGEPLTQTPRVKNPREAAPYTFGYNPSVFVQRVQDVLSALSYIKHHERPSRDIGLVGLDGMGPIAAAARALSQGGVDRAVIDTEGFRFGRVSNLQDPSFVPGGAKYGDVPGLLALSAPGSALIAGESEQNLAAARAIYRAAGNEKNLQTLPDAGASRPSVVEWLLQK